LPLFRKRTRTPPKLLALGEEQRLDAKERWKSSLIHIQTLIFLTTLPTSQDGVENRDQAYWTGEQLDPQVFKPCIMGWLSAISICILPNSGYFLIDLDKQLHNIVEEELWRKNWTLISPSPPISNLNLNWMMRSVILISLGHFYYYYYLFIYSISTAII